MAQSARRRVHAAEVGAARAESRRRLLAEYNLGTVLMRHAFQSWAGATEFNRSLVEGVSRPLRVQLLRELTLSDVAALRLPLGEEPCFWCDEPAGSIYSLGGMYCSFVVVDLTRRSVPFTSRRFVRGVLRANHHDEGDSSVEECDRPLVASPLMLDGAPAYTHVTLPLGLLLGAVACACGRAVLRATRRRQARWVRERQHVVLLDARKGHLGLTLERGAQRLLGAPTLRVAALEERDLAYRAGLRVGDLLLEIDGAPVPRAPYEAIQRMSAHGYTQPSAQHEAKRDEADERQAAALEAAALEAAALEASALEAAADAASALEAATPPTVALQTAPLTPAVLEAAGGEVARLQPSVALEAATLEAAALEAAALEAAALHAPAVELELCYLAAEQSAPPACAPCGCALVRFVNLIEEMRETLAAAVCTASRGRRSRRCACCPCCPCGTRDKTVGVSPAEGDERVLVDTLAFSVGTERSFVDPEGCHGRRGRTEAQATREAPHSPLARYD